MANNRDVQLTIRARNQASGAIESVADALNLLDVAQKNAASGSDDVSDSLSQLGKGLSGLNGVNEKLARTTQDVTGALTRQRQALVEGNSQIEQRRARVVELERALGILSVEADKAFIGPRRNGLDAQIKSVQGSLKSANSDIARLSQVFDRNLAGLRESQGVLRQVRAAETEAKSATAALAAEIELQTQARERDIKATRAQAAAQQFFNNKAAPGLSRQGNSPSDREGIAAVLRVAEARDREILAQQKADFDRLTQSAAKYREQLSGLSPTLQKISNEFKEVFQLRKQGLLGNDEGTRILQSLDARYQAQQKLEAASSDAARAANLEADALQRLRAQINPVAEAEARVGVEVRKLIQWRRQGKISLDEARMALGLYRQQLVAVRTEESKRSGIDSRGRPSLFGLKPYELQNLGFQVNDVVTQLASGTSLSQTLAQQLGQIIQIFPRLGSGIVAAFSSGPIIAFAATIAAVGLALNRASNDAERLRNVQSILASIGNASALSAREVDGAAASLDRLGLSAEDSITAVRTFVRSGLDPARFVQFGLAARDMALVLGIEVPDALKQLTTGLTGGIDAIEQLQDATGVFTDAELERIRVLYESGKAEDARRFAVDRATASYEEAANQARGPWAQAALTFEAAWSDLIGTLANTSFISGTVAALGGLADGVNKLLIAGQNLSASEFFRALFGDVKGTRNPFTVPEAAKPAASAAVVRPRDSSATDRRLAAETRRKLTTDAEVISQQVVQEKLAEFRRQVRQEIQNDEKFKNASPQAITAAVNARSDAERVKLNRQLVDYQTQIASKAKSAADAAKRAAEEQERAAKKAREPAEAQADLNAKLDQEISKRNEIADAERAKFGLQGAALVAEERRQAVAEAERQELDRIVEINRQREQDGKKLLAIDQARVQALKDAAGAEFDARNAQRQANESRRLVDQPIDELTALRDSINTQIAQLQQQGQTGAANVLEQQLLGVNTQLGEAILKAQEFYGAINPESNPFGLTQSALDAIILKLGVAQQQSRQWAYFLGISGQQISQVFAQQAVSAIDKFAEAVANGENVFGSLLDAFRQFAADFLRQIAQMILQQLIFNAISGIFGGATGGGAGFGLIAPFHSGGVVGEARPKRTLDLSMFANATRYHTGGVAGLRSNEVPAVLERGEEVLTADDPRHRANGGGGSGSKVTIINAIDASDVMSKALDTKPGEQALLNFIRTNSGAVKAAMG